MDRLPDPAALRDYFDYKPGSGILSWKIGGKGIRAGRQIKGRLVVINYVPYAVTRVIWAMMAGAWPKPNEYICHADRDPTNQAWNNLVLASRATKICFPNEPAVRYPKRKYAHLNQQTSSV